MKSCLTYTGYVSDREVVAGVMTAVWRASRLRLSVTVSSYRLAI